MTQRWVVLLLVCVLLVFGASVRQLTKSAVVQKDEPEELAVVVPSETEQQQTKPKWARDTAPRPPSNTFSPRTEISATRDNVRNVAPKAMMSNQHPPQFVSTKSSTRVSTRGNRRKHGSRREHNDADMSSDEEQMDAHQQMNALQFQQMASIAGRNRAPPGPSDWSFQQRHEREEAERAVYD